MARPLTPARDGSGIPRIQPQATPLDTFIRPPSAGGSALGQLASALSGIAPELRQVGGAISERDAAVEAARGEAFAADNEASRDAWASLVKDGKIAAAQSPHFVLAAKNKFGKVAAQQYRQVMNDALTKLGDNPTPEQFEQAIADSRKAYLETNAGKAGNDLAFMQGFNAVAEQDIDNARRGFAAQHAKQFEEDATRAFSQSLHADAEKFLADKSMSVEDVAQHINGAVDEWLKSNPSKTLTGSKMAGVKAEVLFSIMQSTGNPNVVKRLAKLVKSGDGVLADDPLWFNNVARMEQQVTAQQRQKELDARADAERAQKDATEQAQDALHTMWATGNTGDTSAIVATLRKAGVENPEVTVAGIMDKLPDLDPKFYVNYRSQIFRGKMPSISTLDDAARKHLISAGQYSQLVSEMEQAQNAEKAARMAGAPTTESIWSHPAMRQLEASIRSAALTKAKTDPITGKIISYVGFTESDVNEAVNDGKRFMAAWLSQNWDKFGPNLSASEQAETAWRGFAKMHGVITEGEAGINDRVLPSNPRAKKSVEKNSGAAPKNAPPTYTAAEIRSLRDTLAAFGTMTEQQRTDYLKKPRIQAIYNALGSPDASNIAQVLADAEAKAAAAHQ